jgi:hypothetical protein
VIYHRARGVYIFLLLYFYFEVIYPLMPSQRDKSKKLVGFFATEEEKKALKKAAKHHGFSTLADFLRAIAEGSVKVSPKIKALTLSAMGAGVEPSGCGGMMAFLVLAIPVAAWLLA